MNRRGQQRGQLVDDPKIVALAADTDPGPRPKRLCLQDGRIVVTYSRTRFYLDRLGWELLPEDGVFLPRIRKTGQQSLTTFAFTKRELESTFGRVRSTASWDDKRCYHYRNVPTATRPFCIPNCSDGDSLSGSHTATLCIARAASAPPDPLILSGPFQRTRQGLNGLAKLRRFVV